MITSPISPVVSGARLPAGPVVAGSQLADLASRDDAQLPQLAPTQGNSAKLLVDEAAVLPAMLGAVRGATSQVDLSMFSLADSGAGAQLIDAMNERAQAGVPVHVTLDQVGSMVGPVGAGAKMVDRMRDAGVNVAINGRIGRDGMNAVDHRKLLILDGKTAFAGGMNFSSKFGKWHDVMVQLDGPAAAQLGAHFVDRWADLTGSVSPQQRATIANGPANGSSGPGDAATGVSLLVNKPKGELHASEDLLGNLRRATDRAWILTPTLSDPAVVKELKEAAGRGVDARVAVSGPEGWIGTRALGLIGSTFYRELVDAGVKVYEQPGMSHAKVSLVDDVAAAGSLNMTRRAMLWDHELMIAGTDTGFVQQVERLFTDDFAKSTEVTPERANSFGNRLGERVRKVTGLKW